MLRRRFLKSLGAAAGVIVAGGTSPGSTAGAAPLGAKSSPIDRRGANTLKTISDRIARFIVNSKFEDLPPAVVQKAKEQLIFFFGRAFEGTSDVKANHLRAVAKRIVQPQGGVTVIAEPFRLLPSDAAFANCSLMRGSTRDDVIWPAGIHGGVVTLPTALAFGEQKRASGRELILSIVLGYEVLGKLGGVAYGWGARLPRRPTTIYGPFGPIVVAGRILGLDERRMSNALGYAANMGIGVPERGMMQHYYSFINRNGMFAAELADAGGAPYSRTTIEGEQGLFRSFFGEVPPTLSKAVDSLGSDWEILRAEQKHYPGTGQSAVAIKLLMEIVGEHRLVAGQIARIDVVMSPQRKLRGQEFLYQGPFSKAVEAYSSLPYALALVLVDGEPVIDRYREDLPMQVYNDDLVAREMSKFNAVFEDGHQSDRYYRVEVHTLDGRKLSRHADNPNIPFPPSVWREWLHRYGDGLLPGSRLRHLERLVGELEDVPTVADLMAAVAPPDSP